MAAASPASGGSPMMKLLMICSLLLVVGGLVAALLIAAAAERWAQARDRARLAPPGQMIDVGGRRLHVVCLGQERPGPAVVLEGGGGNPSIFDRPLADRVAAFAPVCYYDRAGLGWSDGATGPRSFEAIAQDLDRLLTAAGVPGPYVLEGASFGGLAVRAYARAYPEKVAGLVLTDAAEEELVFSRLDNFLAQARRTIGRARWAASLGLVRWMVLRRPESVGLPTDQLTASELAAAAGLMSRDSYWRAAAREAEAYVATPPGMRQAGGFGHLDDKPLVVLAHGRPMAGPQSHLEEGWREGQERLARLSTRGELRIVEDAGHAISLERPDAVAQAIFDVVEQIRATESVRAAR